MTDKKTPIEVIIAPGAFDDFEGTQEELDAFIAKIMEMAQSGELMENATPIDLDELFAEDIDLFETPYPSTRTLQ